MASVSSLDQDMRKLRLDRYTPAAANEIRSWIESMLGERLQSGDLMEALKDGVALCKLVNMAVSPGVRYKQSNMPFVQMENISHFLRACEMAPLNLLAHDRFLTVDLFDGKDPAQVLQCIAAFSRRANAVNPASFPYALGGRAKGSSVSPQGTGGSTGPRSPGYTTTSAIRPRGISETGQPAPAYTFNPLNKAAYSTSGRTSPTKQPPSSLSRGGLATGGPVSSWTDKSDQNNTAPAWNIHQYGYMGGASQGNLGVSFGGRRQITSQGPEVPSLAEKEKRLREKLEQEQREAEERQRRDEAEREAEQERVRQEEERARLEEERRWQEQTRKLREKEDQDRQRHEEQQQRDRQTAERAEREEQRRRTEQEADSAREREVQMAKDRSRQRTTSDARLNGQFLSQYQSGQTRTMPTQPQPPSTDATSEKQRIADLERQLAELRTQQHQATTSPPAPQTAQPPTLPSRTQPQVSHEDDWSTSERDYLRQAWTSQQNPSDYAPPKPPRPTATESTRPLPDPSVYQPNTSRTDRYLTSNPAPRPKDTASHRPQDFSTTTEVDLENQRRLASQTKTKAGGWASKSLLEREMERERARQREWEQSQKETEDRKPDLSQGTGAGQTWDVHQYGYTGGDNQGRNPQMGLGARRQIIGPRPPP